MARNWGTRKRTSKVKWKDVDKADFFYGLIVVVLVIWMIIYSVSTGTAPDNSGF